MVHRRRIQVARVVTGGLLHRLLSKQAILKSIREHLFHRWHPPIDLDHTELGIVKTMRALHDPFIVHDPTDAWEPATDNKLYQDAKAARLQQNVDTPIDERIKYATWPETVLYFSTLSMDSKYNDDVVPLYQYAFREYIDTWTDLDPDQQPGPIGDDSDISSYQDDRLHDLRFGIKKDRDIYFVNHRYNDLDIDTIPKEFWLTDYEREHDHAALDDYAHSAIDTLQND